MIEALLEAIVAILVVCVEFVVAGLVFLVGLLLPSRRAKMVVEWREASAGRKLYKLVAASIALLLFLAACFGLFLFSRAFR